MHVADLTNLYAARSRREHRVEGVRVVEAPWVRAVGWLASGAPITRGRSSPEFVERLRGLCATAFACAEALNWPVAAGLHACEACEAHHSGGNIGVPDGALLFVAPGMIAHYVDAHEYAPPPVFVEAVLRCPMPGTPEYSNAVQGFVLK